MRKLNKPTDGASEVFLTCTSRIRNANFKSRLLAAEPAVVAAASAFEDAANREVLHTLNPYPTAGVTGKEMSDLYENQMVDKRGPARAIYDTILNMPAHGRCPLCGQRIVSTLDHHLPRLHHPALAVVPINLVPCCRDCNGIKLATVPQTSEQQTLHPYFDDIEGARWLAAEVLMTAPAALRFFADPPADWGATLKGRVRHHFRLFKLASLYASHGAEELLNIRHNLRILSARAGQAGVKSHLTERAESAYSVHLNSWQTAAYMALSASDWYCSGGFNLE